MLLVQVIRYEDVYKDCATNKLINFLISRCT